MVEDGGSPVPDPPQRLRSSRRQLRRLLNQKGRLLAEQGAEIERLKAELARRDSFIEDVLIARQVRERLEGDDDTRIDFDTLVREVGFDPMGFS